MDVEVTVVDEYVAAEHFADERKNRRMVDELDERLVEAHKTEQVQRGTVAASAPDAVDGARQARDPLHVEPVLEDDEPFAVEPPSQRGHARGTGARYAEVRK